MSDTNKPCVKCQELGHDKTGEHLYLMLDGVTWGCARNYHDPYYEVDGQEVTKPGGKSVAIPDTVDVSKFKADVIRDIPKAIVEKYDIKVEFDTGIGEPIKHYYPITIKRGSEIVAWKVRTLDKKTFAVVPAVGKNKVDLFGMRSSDFTPNTIIITEGELDAPAAYTMMYKHVKQLMCLSLPFGANIKAVLDNLDFLKQADDIIFAGDMDDPGKQIVDDLSIALPGIRIMQYSEKDPCDMLLEGKAAEFRDAFGNAKVHKPTSIIEVSDIEDEALCPVPWGLSYPFKGLTKITYGLPTKAIIGIGAGPGTGKTSFIKAIETHIIFEHKQPIGIFSFEETPAQTLRSLAGYMIGKPVHLPDCQYDERKLQIAIHQLKGLVYIYNHKGYRDWSDVEQCMTYFAQLGVKHQFIDPLSALTAHLSSSDANTYLNNAMFTMSRLTQALDMSIFHVNHLNNPSTGKDHGAGGKVYGSQFTGSRAMWKFSTDLWGLERNQLADDKAERNKTKLVILKNRLSGVTGVVNMKYNHDTGQLEEVGATAGAASFTDLVNK